MFMLGNTDLMSFSGDKLFLGHVSILWFDIFRNQTHNNQPTNALLFFKDIIYYSLLRYVSIPPGITIRDSCESLNYTTQTYNISTC
jgi:hypothetical protein